MLAKAFDRASNAELSGTGLGYRALARESVGPIKTIGPRWRCQKPHRIEGFRWNQALVDAVGCRPSETGSPVAETFFSAVIRLGLSGPVSVGFQAENQWRLGYLRDEQCPIWPCARHYRYMEERRGP